MLLLRHLFAIVVLPFVVVVVVPHWLMSGVYGYVTSWSTGAQTMLGGVLGAILFLAGFALFAWCLFLFAARGKGTLAPWDPPRHLVVSGPYRYVRNPMISGVLAMVTGEALLHGALVLGLWALTFFLINQIYFMVLEEPGLERRFGEEYRKYKAGVPRWIPRRTPWP